MGKPRFDQFRCPNRMFYLTQSPSSGMAAWHGLRVRMPSLGTEIMNLSLLPQLPFLLLWREGSQQEQLQGLRQRVQLLTQVELKELHLNLRNFPIWI